MPALVRPVGRLCSDFAAAVNSLADEWAWPVAGSKWRVLRARSAGCLADGVSVHDLVRR